MSFNSRLKKLKAKLALSNDNYLGWFYYYESRYNKNEDEYSLQLALWYLFLAYYYGHILTLDDLLILEESYEFNSQTSEQTVPCLKSI